MVTPAGQPLPGQQDPPVLPDPTGEQIPPASGQEAPGEGEPQYVTKAELDAAMEKNIRDAQSLVDKAQANNQKRIAEALKGVDQVAALAKKTGKPMTDEQVSALKAQAREEALNASDDSPAGGMQQGPPPDADPITREVYDLQQNRGVFLEDGDPEIATIVPNQGLVTYFDTIRRALDAKKQRLASTQLPPNQPITPEIPPTGRMITRGTPAPANSITNITDSKTLYELGDAQMRKGKKR